MSDDREAVTPRKPTPAAMPAVDDKVKSMLHLFGGLLSEVERVEFLREAMAYRCGDCYQKCKEIAAGLYQCEHCP